MAHYFSTLSPAAIAAMASVGGTARVRKYGPDAAVSAARAGFLARFDNEVDPSGQMDPKKRQQLSKLALTRYMRKMALARTTAASKREARS